jgi:hypothetical protein
MSATRNLMSSALFALPHISYQPIQVSRDEPALTAANMVKQTMLGAPFRWPWNRAELQFPVRVQQQEYTVNAPNFGFPERFILRAAGGQVKEIDVKPSAPIESTVARPGSGAVQIDNGDGTVQIRFNTRPEQSYTAVLVYQQRAVTMTSMASLWRPIPDHLSYIVDWGFLAMMSLLIKDSRFPVFRQTFTAHLLGAQEGMDATARNLFLGNWLETAAAAQRNQQQTQQGITARTL